MAIHNPQERGLIKYILLFIIFVIILGYFNIDLRGIIEKPEVQKNLAYIKEAGQNIWQNIILPLWHNYLSEPVLYFWQNIFIDIVWRAFTEGLEILKR
ncbi:MAG: hypothetical protein COW88_00490 [Candidatus Lloydbacteria bacterium CG22_combo_CG10-13_8_21_14_all_47_15]|uniref:Uncharacterized protein n=1 Tax=Candidatus Lloydbacteria bacterium CG22_combo_CG10-13_8_21_14_all_47_15 TaxID=1974635 RepID=A0A2H0CWT9_9BACT|nr:MAG: hypothetical protein COW88_00490 [Candidatus Lloydbacteria bacterium CG22_combo_CG10-13_8_21_14_all_47_15]